MYDLTLKSLKLRPGGLLIDVARSLWREASTPVVSGWNQRTITDPDAFAGFLMIMQPLGRETIPHKEPHDPPTPSTPPPPFIVIIILPF